MHIEQVTEVTGELVDAFLSDKVGPAAPNLRAV